MAKVCAFCGKTIGAFTTARNISGHDFLFCDSHLEYKVHITNAFLENINADVSSIVEAFHNSLKNKADTCEAATEALVRSIQDGINREIQKKQEQAEEEQAAREEEERRKEQLRLEEQRRIEIEKERRQNLAQNLSTLMTTTGYSFDGYKIDKYIDIISGETVLGTGFLSEWSAALADVTGMSSGLFSGKLSSAKITAFNAMKESCVMKGGNAIIGVDFDYITFANNMIGVVANGTAVHIVKDTTNGD